MTNPIADIISTTVQHHRAPVTVDFQESFVKMVGPDGGAIIHYSLAPTDHRLLIKKIADSLKACWRGFPETLGVKK